MKRFVAAALLFLGIASCVPIISAGYGINRDIESWKNRAQVSSEPNDMLEYLTNVQIGMEVWGMTSRNSALFFPTADGDMALIYRTVLQHVDQARVLTTMERDTPEYQTGLDNLRGSIRELDLHSHEYWARWYGLIWWIGGTLGWVGLSVWVFVESMA